MTEILLLLLSPPRSPSNAHTGAGQPARSRRSHRRRSDRWIPLGALAVAAALLSGCAANSAKTRPTTQRPARPAERSESITQIMSGPDHGVEAIVDSMFTTSDDTLGETEETTVANGSSAQDWLDSAEESLEIAARRLEAHDRAGYEQAMVDAHHAMWRAETALAEDPQALAVLAPIYEKLIVDLREGFSAPGAPTEPASEPVTELDASPAELAAAEPSEAARASYDMPIDPDNPLVAKYLALFQEGQRRRYLEETFRRSDRYREMVLREIHAAGLPEELWAVPIIESGYKVSAYSRARAVGLW
ncbi:MAG TPA: hypothetical protein VNM87_07825, partial [Candidatus Udaeobacter sp.]|nr:hypothetical protein [Candidatus Udaeobacter sp.]